MEILNPLLKPLDVAEILGIKLSTVYKYSMSGRLPTVKINGSLRFRQDQLRDFINEHSSECITATG